jgi:hypothetical protein
MLLSRSRSAAWMFPAGPLTWCGGDVSSSTPVSLWSVTLPCQTIDSRGVGTLDGRGGVGMTSTHTDLDGVGVEGVDDEPVGDEPVGDEVVLEEADVDGAEVADEDWFSDEQPQRSG